jgi:hypothetical protein
MQAYQSSHPYLTGVASPRKRMTYSLLSEFLIIGSDFTEIVWKLTSLSCTLSHLHANCRAWEEIFFTAEIEKRFSLLQRLRRDFLYCRDWEEISSLQRLSRVFLLAETVKRFLHCQDWEEIFFYFINWEEIWSAERLKTDFFSAKNAKLQRLWEILHCKD